MAGSAVHAPGIAALAGLAFFTFWFGPLPEEIGWRGYALDRLQAGRSALWASVILALVWACWHLPLFFLPGTFQHALGVNSARFWIFVASLVPLSILITWIYNNTARSTLSAAVMHFSGNFMGMLFMKSPRVAAFELILLTLAGISVVSLYGPRWLAAVNATPEPTHVPQ